MKLTLTRLYERGQATIGNLMFEGLSHPLWTLEDLWKGNARNISCIPPGVYKCVPHGWNGEPVKFKRVWRLIDVPDRSGIVVHSGSSHEDTRGCLLPGMKARGDRILHSRVAIDLLRLAIGEREFTLEIIDNIKR